MATLEALAAVRSQKALRLRAHLEWVERGEPWVTPPWLNGTPFTLDDVYAVPDVTPRDQGFKRPTRDGEEREAVEPVGREGPDRVPWNDAWAAIRSGGQHAVIVGRAGEGKSTLLRWTSRELARESLRAWDERAQTLETIPIPLVIKAEQLMRAGSLRAAIERAPATRTGQDRPVTAPDGLTTHEMLAALDHSATWVFVDALDERPADSEAPVAAALQSLGGKRARMILSVRTYAWYPDTLPFRVESFGPVRSSRGHQQRRSPDPTEPLNASTDALHVFELAKLSGTQRQWIVSAWHPPDAGGGRHAQLVALLNVQPMAELTNNALLLTLLCAAARVPDRRISAATRRAELYDWLVADFLARPDTPDGLALDPRSNQVQTAIAVLAHAAWALWQITTGADFTVGQWTHHVSAAATGLSADGPWVLRQTESAGLLLTLGPRRNFFPRTVFEYLAGAGLVQRAANAPQDVACLEAVASTFTAHGHDDAWREVLTLAIGHLAAVQHLAGAVSEVVVRTLVNAGSLSGDARAKVTALLAEAADEAGEQGQDLMQPLSPEGAVPAPVLAEAVRDALRIDLLAAMRNMDPLGSAAHVPAKTRARAGTALGRIGDHRFHGPNLWRLPNDPQCRDRGSCHAEAGLEASADLLGFVWVQPPEPGWFWIGSDASDGDAHPDEKPLQRVRMTKGFYLARWPVTVAQFAEFATRQPYDTGDGEFWRAGGTNHPVVNVSWHDANAYCKWLSLQMTRDVECLSGLLREQVTQWDTDWGVMLPTEPQWEWAARGPDRHRYPGAPMLTPDQANTRATEVGTTSAVGCFPASASWCGAEDMAGNVWEWSRSRFRAYSADEAAAQEAGRDGPGGDGPRVLRGGSFLDLRWRARAAYRLHGGPVSRYGHFGFRVALCPFRS